MSRPSSPGYKIAIIGAGPAGCILARLLQPLKVDVAIFESDQSSNFRAQGGTLDLHEDTGLYALRKANLYPDFLEFARFDGDALAVCDKHLLRYLDLKSTKDGGWFAQGKPEIDRAELRKLLYDCLSEGTIRWGYKLKCMDASTLELHFENGIVEGGFDLVIGADGAWSKVRPLLTPVQPLFSGTGGHNLVISHAKNKFPDLVKFINHGSVFAISDGRTIMGQQMGDGSIYVSIWGLRGKNWMEEAGYDVSDGKAVKKALTEEYKDWDGRFLELIQAADAEKVTPRSLFMLPVGSRWESRPGLTLVGDAAHLMTPFVGEGVNAAMKDAVELAEAIDLAIQDGGGKECLHGRIREYETTCEPLRILFCGSDEFSLASLRALCKEHKRDKALIESIDVVSRPPKPIGRGLKHTSEVPIALGAKELALSLHSIDTFTKWKPPTPHGFPINLIVAVSFGLFVPPRILQGARYGGLNVHPSILPDFYGPAPLHHTLLSGSSRSGVTVQTLHPEHFDQGTILAQTPYPGFKHGCRTVPELLSLMASKGAEMLVHSIRNCLFLQSGKMPDVLHDGWTTAKSRAAPKITSKDRFIDWNAWTAEEIIRRHLVVGPLWSFIQNAGHVRRLIWTTGFTISEEFGFGMPYIRDSGIPSDRLRPKTPENNGGPGCAIDLPVGRLIVFGDENSPDKQVAYVRTCDDRLLKVDMIKIEGGVESPPLRAANKADMIDYGTYRRNGLIAEISLSTDPLAGD